MCLSEVQGYSRAISREGIPVVVARVLCLNVFYDRGAPLFFLILPLNLGA